MYSKRKIKILLCIDWFTPGFKAGGPISSAVNFVKGLEADFELYVLTTDTDLGAEVPYPEVSANTWLAFGRAAQVLYLSKKQVRPAVIRRHIQQIQPDYLYLNSLFSTYFTLVPLGLKKLGLIQTAIVLSPRGMLRESALRYKPLKKKLFLALAKAGGLYRGVRFHATDEQELKDIRTHLPQVQSVQLIPNLAKMPPQEILPIEKRSGQLRLVFIGRIHPIKNLLFLLQLLQKVQQFRVELSIIGNVEDAVYWQQCQYAIAALPACVKVEYHGGVPAAAIESYLQQHHGLILPTQGENFGHVIFESFSVGRPVVISDQTPWRNLESEKVGFDLPLQEPERWLKALETLATMEQPEYEAWMTNVLAFAKNYIATTDAKSKYLELFG